MMERLTERGEQLARAGQDAAIEDVADAMREAAPGAAIEIDGDQVAVVGRGLLKQWLDSANLRFLTSKRR